MKNLVAIMVTLLGVFFSNAFADSGTNLFERGRSFYISAKEMQSGNSKTNALEKAVSELRKFVQLYPDHPKTSEAYFNLGSAYSALALASKDRESAASALHYFREVVRRDSKDHLANESLRGISEVCLKVLEDTHCSEEALARIQESTAELSRIEVERKGDGIILHLPIGSVRTFTSNTLSSNADEKLPQRFYVDVEDTKLGPIQVPSFSEQDPIRQVRLGQNGKNVRIVLDLAPNTIPSQIKASPESGGLVISLGVHEEVKTVEVAKAPPPIVEVEPKIISKLRIVLDAGHGGEDSGARGRYGTEEKDICLAIAKRVFELLAPRSEYEVFMTRNEDKFVPLSDRTKFANRMGGDLFVSIHANASPRKSAEGISTYILDNHDDAESLRVALRENFEPNVVSGPATPENENQYLEIMKASMVKNYHTAQSTVFAQKVQSSMVHELQTQFSGITNLGVKSARFYVLTGAEMPAVLVETSFISNAQEERRLRDSKYQKSIARAVVKGIDQFVKSSEGKGDHAALYQR